MATSDPYGVEVYDLYLYHGNTKRIQLRAWADDDRTIASDLTGVEVLAQIRNKPLPLGVVLTTLEADITLPNIIDVVVQPDMYASMPKGGVWDCQFTLANGDIDTIVRGKVKIKPDVTEIPVP